MKILILENDLKLDINKHHYVFGFLEAHPDAEIIDFSGFRHKRTDEIFEAVNQCTDIVTQTCLINGSEQQFDQMLMLLSKISEPKNIYIALLGDDLGEYFDSYIEDKELTLIQQHKIFSLGHCGEATQLDFSARINTYLNKIKAEENYTLSAQSRPTGRKIKILACNGCGNAFNGLPIGGIVPELDMSEQDTNSNRGVWIWGNGEPIKLVNDCGLKEYEVAGDLSTTDIFTMIEKSTPANISELTPLQIIGLASIIEDEGISAEERANFICEELNIPKRGNRAFIFNLLGKLNLNPQTL